MPDRSRVWNAVGWVGLAVALLVLLAALPTLTARGVAPVLEGLGYQGFVFAWVLLLTSRTRTVGVRTVFSVWVLGAFGGSLLSLVLSWPFHGALDRQAAASVWGVPLVDAVVETLPVLALVVASGYARRGPPSLSDALVLGLAVGGGMAFLEDGLYGRVTGDGFAGALPWSLLLPTITRGEFLVLGEAGRAVETAIVLYHPGWAAVQGLAVGAVLFFRGKFLTWLCPVVAFAACILSHALVNQYVWSANHFEAVPAWTSAASAVTLGGLLPGLLLLGGLAAAILLDRGMLRWAEARDRMFPRPALWQVVRAAGAGDVRRGARLGAYRHALNAAHLSMWRWVRGFASLDPNDAVRVELGLRRLKERAQG